MENYNPGTIETSLNEDGFNWKQGKIYLPDGRGGFEQLPPDDRRLRQHWHEDNTYLQWFFALDDRFHYSVCIAVLGLLPPKKIPIKLARESIEFVQVNPDTLVYTSQAIREVLRERDIMVGRYEKNGTTLHVAGVREYGLYCASLSEDFALRALATVMYAQLRTLDCSCALFDDAVKASSNKMMEELRNAVSGWGSSDTEN